MRSVWAVARNTIAQALRMKIVFVVIILLLAILPLMSKIIVGDETLHGKLQTFVSYGLSLMTMLLCIKRICRISTDALCIWLTMRKICAFYSARVGRCRSPYFL